ncbi:unnamed protein product [Allacma fusca]|uniref:Uncharacterized protein n=1 Tax=Allacma fusca TaxID=39272 RepID=A0A8J2KJ38_9HEXA|nr:unnamed protein product [Allacma fusca]
MGDDYIFLASTLRKDLIFGPSRRIKSEEVTTSRDMLKTYPTFQSLYTQRKNHASYAHEGNSEIIPPNELRKYEYHHLASCFKRDGGLSSSFELQPEHHPNTPILVPSDDEDFSSTSGDELDTMEVQGSITNTVTSTVTNDSGAQGNG